jgi:hypothetical protein
MPDTKQFQKLLGVSASASSPVKTCGVDRYEMGSIPAQSSQKNWRYLLTKDGDSRMIHLDGGNGRTFSFRFAGDPVKPEDFSSGAPIALTRIGDSTRHEKNEAKGETVSKGVIQVHKSTPTSIHATLQDGKSNSTVMFEQGDDGWTMRAAPKKKKLSEVAGNFARALSKQAIDPSVGVPINKDDILPFSKIRTAVQDASHLQRNNLGYNQFGGPGAFPASSRSVRGFHRSAISTTPSPVPTPSPWSKFISTTPLKSLMAQPLDQTVQKVAKNEDGYKVYAVDLDGTLAERYKGEFDPKVIGDPIKSMRRLVRLWTRRGNEVRIFTARAADPKNIPPIKKWLEENGMGGLKITNEKTPDIDIFVDDKAVAVTPDTGESCHRKLAAVMKMYKVSAATWHRPENFDSVSDSGLPDSSWALYVGANDWEAGVTWGAVYRQKDITQSGTSSAVPRVWVEIDHDDCPGCDGSCDPIGLVDKQKCNDFGRKVVKRWVREAGQGSSGALEDRLYSAARMDPDVKTYGRAAQKTAEDLNLVHYSRNKHPDLRPLNYGELEKDRTSGSWEDKPELAQRYVQDRKSFESDLHRRLAQRGIEHPRDSSFLYATIDGRERFNPHWGFKHTAPLSDDVIQKSFFGVAGDGKDRITIGRLGLASALRRWDVAEKEDKLQDSEYMGLKIRPRIEVITPTSISPTSIEKAAATHSSYLKTLCDKFTAARKDVHLTPSPAQIKAENWRKGHVWMNGFDITIENPKGSSRSGTAPDGTKWKSTMAADYGDIRNYPRSKADGDNMDVFVGPHPSSEMAYVIDQYINSKFDEHKIVLGCFTEKEAKAIYQDSFDKNWKGLGDVTALTIRQLKSWLNDGDTSKPLHGQSLAKHVKQAMDECDREEKLAADNSWMPAPVASVLNNPLITNTGLAVGSGALRGALVAALIHGARTLKRENLDQPKRDLNLTRDLALGGAIGAGSGLLLHYTPEILGFAHNALGTSKAAHIMDVPLAPLHLGGIAGTLVGTGYGAIAGAAKGVGGKIKRFFTGEPEDPYQFEDDVLNGAQQGLNIGSMASLGGMNPASAPALQAATTRFKKTVPVVKSKIPQYTFPRNIPHR